MHSQDQIAKMRRIARERYHAFSSPFEVSGVLSAKMAALTERLRHRRESGSRNEQALCLIQIAATAGLALDELYADLPDSEFNDYHNLPS